MEDGDMGQYGVLWLIEGIYPTLWVCIYKYIYIHTHIQWGVVYNQHDTVFGLTRKCERYPQNCQFSSKKWWWDNEVPPFSDTCKSSMRTNTYPPTRVDPYFFRTGHQGSAQIAAFPAQRSNSIWRNRTKLNSIPLCCSLAECTMS